MTGGWRWALSRGRFSWVELIAIALGLRQAVAGHWLAALLLVVIGALTQALLESWPE